MFGALVVATAVAVITAGPAGAVDDTTTTTFIVSAGALAIDAPASPVALGSGSPGGTITAQLGNVVVTDARAQLAPTWAATVASADFSTGGETPQTIGKALVDYWSGPAISPTGSGTTFVPGQATADDKVTLAASRAAFALTAGVGNNSVAWNPTLIVNVPATAVGSEYTGTVTHSVV